MQRSVMLDINQPYDEMIVPAGRDGLTPCSLICSFEEKGYTEAAYARAFRRSA